MASIVGFATPCTSRCSFTRLVKRLVIPNWLVCPSYLVAMVLLFAFRLRPEERMMVEEFGKDYEAYRMSTKRLIPGIW